MHQVTSLDPYLFAKPAGGDVTASHPVVRFPGQYSLLDLFTVKYITLPCTVPYDEGFYAIGPNPTVIETARQGL